MTETPRLYPYAGYFGGCLNPSAKLTIIDSDTVRRKLAEPLEVPVSVVDTASALARKKQLQNQRNNSIDNHRTNWGKK